MFIVFEKEMVEILLIASMARMFALRREIMEGVRRLRLPAIFGAAAWAEGGGLLAYGPNLLDNLRHVAEFIDRILKGARPADLPLRQTTKYDFVINLKAAREIGVAIPQSILVRADRVIDSGGDARVIDRHAFLLTAAALLAGVPGYSRAGRASTASNPSRRKSS
jgi:putative ABC transport system substrate-binding protein